jgi:hypothetical protein
MKNKKYIVTEGETDKEVLMAILPKSIIEDSEIVSSRGYSDALSVARSLISSKDHGKVALVVDSDTTDDNELEERKEFINHYIGDVGSKRYRVFMFTPNIESLLTSDRKILEKLLKKNLKDSDWYKIIVSPKRYLTYKIISKTLMEHKKLLENYSKEKSETVKDLIHYLE